MLILVIVSVVGSLLGNLLIMSGISSSNATVASIVEITYPIFVVLVGYLIFGEGHLSLPIMGGGLLIFLGVTIIYWKG